MRFSHTANDADGAVAHALLGHVGQSARARPCRGDVPSITSPPIDDRSGDCVAAVRRSPRPARAARCRRRRRCRGPRRRARPTTRRRRRSAPRSPTTVSPPTARRDVARCPIGAVGDQLDRPTDHQVGELLTGRGLREHLAGDHAVAHHGDAVGERHHLVQLVGDEHEPAPGVGHPPQGGEQLVDLLRRQHRGRLVEDEQARLVEHRLEDLDPLTLADRRAARPWRADGRRARTRR